ncbi:hypothetical protein HZC31_01075 [Candidatus Woesearchaeota archaeon]|nr:hypothetical protein [Candidatus Woesearchaeota archaeon]
MELNLSIKTKLILAIITVIISLVMGLYTKFMFFLHLPYYIDWWNLVWYIISWIMLFVAGFFVGKEALQIADLYVKKKLQETYTATVDLHKEGLKRGIETTKKGFETTRDIGKKTIHFHKRMLGIDELEFQKKRKK